MKHIENLIRPALLLASVFLLGGCGSDHSSDKVQLWEGGPYWATKNIGAEKPEDYGLYFWWGDTVGYRRDGNAWVASDGSSSDFSFEEGNTPTYNKSKFILRGRGWITSVDVIAPTLGEAVEIKILAPALDAAQSHWGGSWRMPTHLELASLADKCNWVWTTRNGVNGYVVSGRGHYASASIFLPAAGYGFGTSLSSAGSYGYCWSSVPESDNYGAMNLYFRSDSHITGDVSWRCYGFSVRPVQGFEK